ncbi:MAG: hypothetical protein R6U88_04095 [Candidatus Bipolaricaulota bacterium]
MMTPLRQVHYLSDWVGRATALASMGPGPIFCGRASSEAAALSGVRLGHVLTETEEMLEHASVDDPTT